MQGFGVTLDRHQGVRDILERGVDRAAVLRGGDVQRGDGGSLACAQRAALKNRLRETAGDAPDDATGGEDGG